MLLKATTLYEAVICKFPLEIAVMLYTIISWYQSQFKSLVK